jgi:hypothetical protein
MKLTNYSGKRADGFKAPFSATKYKSHGSYRAKRKPNSPKVKTDE